MSDKEPFRGARAMRNILSRKKSNSDPSINANKSSKQDSAEVNGETGKCPHLLHFFHNHFFRKLPNGCYLFHHK